MKQVPKDQIHKRLNIENPWWENGGQIPKIFREYSPRAYLDLFYPLVESRKVHRANVLMGPRRVGKTVLIHHAIQKLIDENGVDPKRILYLSVDHPIYNGQSLDAFLEFYSEVAGVDTAEEECYVFFDEIQYLKDWEIHLKAIVDRFRNLKCTVSGSAAAALKLKSNESGAGRFTDFLLPPLTFHEYLDLLGKDDLLHNESNPTGVIVKHSDFNELNRLFVDYLNFGGYPEAVFSEDIQADPSRFIKNDIIDKVLLRDLPGLYGIQDIQELNSLFMTLAYNTSNEISLEELSKNSGVSKNTIKKYIEYFEAAFLIKVVHRVNQNAKRFKRANHFKVYLTNPSIRSALFSPVAHDDEVMGGLAETAAFSQWFHAPTQLHYARWKDGEVDIVLSGEDQKPVWITEVKWSDRYFKRPSDLKNVLFFCRENGLKKAVVTTLTEVGKKEVEGIQIGFMPASIYCYSVGYNIIKGKRGMDSLPT